MTQPPDKQAIELNSSLEHVDIARDFVAEIARRVPMNAQEVHDLELVVTEAMTNVVEHAYDGDERCRVELSVSHDRQHFAIVIRHDGRDFDPAAHPDPVMRDYLAERRVGGLGLYLIKKLMDEVEYTTNDAGQRQIRMVKRHAAVEPGGEPAC